MDKSLQQYMTPAWAAERLVETFYGHLTPSDLVCEPTCGTGAFLAAIPQAVPAFGVEIDAALAAQARQNSGRTVYAGDICSIPLTEEPTHVLGNPPFAASTFDRILARCHAMLPASGEAAFILPAYIFQTAARVVGYNDQWGIESHLIPRNIFDGLEKPLVWAIFRKGARKLWGFALYADTVGVRNLKDQYRDLLRSAQGSAWRAVVYEALVTLGGEASLDEIYREVAGRRPYENGHWKPQIRKIAQQSLVRVGRGRYALDQKNLAARAA